VDRLFGFLLTRFLSKPVLRPFPNPKHILVIRPGGIGDAVHLIPAITSLRMKYPESVIDILAEKRNGAVFSLMQGISNVFHYDKLHELLRVYSSRYDLVIDTEQWHRLSAVVARLTRAPMLIGFDTNDRSRLFTHKVLYSHNDYEVDSFLNLLAPLNITARQGLTSRFLSIPVPVVEKSVELLGELAAKRFVAIFPGASIPERRWGAEKFAVIAQRLFNDGIPSVVIGGRGDSSEGDRIVAGGHGLNLAGRTSLAETAAVIDKCTLFVSGDSGLLHIAVGLDKPTVSLFGPGIARKWAPRGDRHTVINKCLPCSPCTRFGYTPKCPIHAKCMADITVDDVVESIEQLLGRTEFC
jgi:lipopolysaccharide heptosyltransferase II